MSAHCLTCIHYKARLTPDGDDTYTFCQKSVSKASATFSCIWHTTKKDTK